MEKNLKSLLVDICKRKIKQVQEEKTKLTIIKLNLNRKNQIETKTTRKKSLEKDKVIWTKNSRLDLFVKGFEKRDCL